ncbi:12436_t:CDS:1, partial [Racocetra persica]
SDDEMGDKKSEGSPEQNSEANDPEHYHGNRVDAEKDNFVKATVNNDDET